MMTPDEGPPCHALTAAQVLAHWQTTAAGLDNTDAEQRRAQHGSNRLPEPPRRHPLLRFLAHFNNVLIHVLLGAAAVTALLAHWVDT
ncbi:hypothetical protein EO238_27595, partial [Citrobacter sp. AAK_AS5]